MDSATRDVVTECVAGSQIQIDLFSTQTGCSVVVRRDKRLSRLIYVYYYPNESKIAH